MRTFLQHVFLWFIIFVGYTIMLAHYGNLYEAILVNSINVPLFIIAYYLLRYVQIPYLYDRKKIVWFWLSFLVSSFMLTVICRSIGILGLDAALNEDSCEIPFVTLGSYLLKTGRFYFPALALLAWESHEERRKELEQMQELEKEKLANELKYLKAQLNPHFLFNTLNNLYSYVVMQSPKAPDMIMCLSGILDYVLYKSQYKSVSLSEEVNTIEHFLVLEQIRYGDRLQVDYNTEGNLTLPISPLILLSLVENAFKHGASGDIDSPRIKINIKGEAEHITCTVWNTKSKHTGELNDAYKKGIGLSNIKRQLNLTYQDKHKLTIEECDESFSVALLIEAL